jgi:ABC-type uncharacterized transport system auxiliary subunit
MLASVRSLAALLALLGLVSCASGPAQRDHFYRLDVPAPASPRTVPVLPGVVEIDRPRADHLVRERPILHSEGGNAIEVTPYVYHLWVDSPTLMVQRELARWFDVSGVASQTVLPEAGVRERWLVTGRLERFEHVVPEGVALVVLELRLKDQKSGDLRVQRRYEARAPAGGAIDAAIPAFGVAVGSIFEQFAADVAAKK